MLDIRFIRDNAARVAEASAQKGYKIDIPHLLELDSNRRELQTKADELRAQRNGIAAQMKGGKPEPSLVEQGRVLKVQLAEVEDHLRITDEEFTRLLKTVPNMPLNYVPVGTSEDENVVAKPVGEPPT